MSEPSRISGTLEKTKGNIVEAIGTVTGSEDWIKSGKAEQIAGANEYEAARLQQELRGWKNDIVGQVKEATSLTDSQTAEGQAQSALGKAEKATAI